MISLHRRDATTHRHPSRAQTPASPRVPHPRHHRPLTRPIAIVSIVDTDRIWFKSRHGLDVEQIERGPGLCSSAILQRQPWVVTDAAADPRTLVNPLVAGEFGLRFYAGVPLTTHDGHNLGILCVIDYQPREVTADEVATLTDLAGLTMDELEIRRAAREHRWAGVRPA